MNKNSDKKDNDKMFAHAPINWYITTYDKTPLIPYLISNFC